MRTNRTLYIEECYFNLPNDFDGTLGEALALLANRALEAEMYDEICDYYGDYYGMHDHLKNNNKAKCSISWRIIEEN